MTIEVLMPVVTAAGEEAVVTAWFVDDEQPCTAGQLLAEVQAEKVASEVLAPEGGFVVDRVAIGDPVRQGDPICRVVDSIEPSGTSEQAGAARPEPKPGVRASPAAKRVARELGVDLAGLDGSGPDGRITEGDVRAAVEGPGPEGMSGLRSVIARNMRRSHTEAAEVTLFTTADLGPSRPGQLTATVVTRVARVLASHPQLNGTRVGDVFTPAPGVGIALAIQTDEGLVAPVVRDPAARSVDEVHAEIQDLAERARARKLTAADYEAGTFSVTNLGAYGVEGFTPIINLPQVAILGVGAARRVPSVDRDGEVCVSHHMALSLTFDHAFVDGAPAATFLQEVRSSLEG